MFRWKRSIWSTSAYIQIRIFKHPISLNSMRMKRKSILKGMESSVFYRINSIYFILMKVQAVSIDCRPFRNGFVLFVHWKSVLLNKLIRWWPMNCGVSVYPYQCTSNDNQTNSYRNGIFWTATQKKNTIKKATIN